jgi:hypothetical protein
MRMQFYAAVVGIALAGSLTGCLSDGGSDEDPEIGESTSALALDAPFRDFSTVCTVGGVSMHCCPSGSVMVGIHVGRNVLKCARPFAGTFGTRTLDAGTNRNDMHACPRGQLMVGIRVDQNLLVCESPRQIVGLELVDAVTNDSFPMHVCPETFAMAGIRVDRNLLTCDQ